jgi:hypothetical protein
MAFEYAYSLDGVIAPLVKDLPLDTLSNYQNATGTNGVKRGDLVFIDGTSGLVKRTKAGAGILATGVIEGKEFLGLVAQGQDYAAVNASFTAQSLDTTRNPNGVAKVNIDKTTVWRVPASAAASAANVGKSYGITNAASGDQTVNLADTTNTVVKVLDYITKNGVNYVYVTINSTATI